MNSNTPIPSPYYANDRHRVLLSLRVLSILTSLAALSTLAWTIPAHENVSNDGVGSGVTPGVVASTAYAFLWSSTVLILRYILHTPIHPGVYLAFDFIAFGLLAGCTIVMVIMIEPFFNSSYACAVGNNCDGGLLARVEWFGAFMGLVCCAIHLGLFVWACWATDRERKIAKGRNVVAPGKEVA
ncbi:hypothetical protein ASPCAL13543 [Aspergillus calidoustus]|uniref:MARVEL domain-containing protein n=1 Tax=Aspergillus calidoustus TaxID=454130 RepID=A0A0U5GHX1_ASPCI|nr:hypothetical protein ASPCAL13543 [Aspergillus calidoustus]